MAPDFGRSDAWRRRAESLKLEGRCANPLRSRRFQTLLERGGPRENDGMEDTGRIVREPAICGGEPIIRGTRVTLRTVLASLSDGDSTEQILAAFPTLTEGDVRAVIVFAAESAKDDLPTPALPSL